MKPKRKRMTAQQLQVKLRHDFFFYASYYLWLKERR